MSDVVQYFCSFLCKQNPFGIKNNDTIRKQNYKLLMLDRVVLSDAEIETFFVLQSSPVTEKVILK
jgi:hypothetical protein